MTIAFVRTIILYSLVIFAVRMMGKRQIGELSPSELVVAIMLSDLAVLPAQDTDYSLLSGVVPIVTLLVIELMLSYLALKSNLFRRMLSGRPTVLIQDGIIQEKQLEKLRFNLDDLLEQLRAAGYPDLSQLDFVMMEANGTLSVIPRTATEPPSAEDMGVKVKQLRAGTMVIADGVLRKKALPALGISENWVKARLKEQKIKRMEDVLIFMVDQDKKTFLQRKDGK